MKAKELKREFFPRQELVKAYKDADQNYELKGLDRVWDRFYPLVTANPKLREQEIQVKITQLYRLEDLEIPDLLSIEGMPIFHYEVDPQTDEVIANSTQVLDTQKVYTIPFSKEKIAEISGHFVHPVHCIIVDGSNKRYSCSAKEFAEMDYDELLDLKTGYADYLKTRQQQKRGGAK